MSLVLSSGKREVAIDPPWMNAAGALGFADEASLLQGGSRPGAFVTAPVSLGPRTPAQGTRLAHYPGGFLLHTGLPNPGLRAVLGKRRSHWATLPCPVILHALATTPREMGALAERLEGVGEVSALEIGLAEAEAREAESLVRAAATAGLPVMAQVAPGTGWEVVQAAIKAGAAALVVGPPRGAIQEPGGEIVHGRLYGPALLPLILHTVSGLCTRVDVPVLGGAGIYSREDGEAVFAAGAAAVQYDSVLWTEPEALFGGLPRVAGSGSQLGASNG